MAKKVLPLSPKERLFCLRFTDIDNPELFGKSTAAAAAAGLSKNKATRMLRDDRVQAEICRQYERRLTKAMVSPSKILADLEHTRLRALDKGDLMAAARCSELEGKTFAMFAERFAIQTAPERAEQMSEAHMAELLELSKLRHLRNRPVLDSPESTAIDAQFQSCSGALLALPCECPAEENDLTELPENNTETELEQGGTNE
jgi:hypothetical protein